MLLFIYWHAAAIKEYISTKNKNEKHEIMLFLILTMDISFILSVVYTSFGYFFYNLNLCTDYPSIWCTFAVTQAFFLLLLFHKVSKGFPRPKKEHSQKIKTTFTLFIISIIILLLLIIFLPYFDCLTWKSVFP